MKHVFKYAGLAALALCFAACAIEEPGAYEEPAPAYGYGAYSYGPPVYYSPQPYYYAAPPPVISFGFGGRGYHGRGRW